MLLTSKISNKVSIAIEFRQGILLYSYSLITKTLLKNVMLSLVLKFGQGRVFRYAIWAIISENARIRLLYAT